MKQQKGFTLVEMAIVLVIIGLLLGGVLKGQELIENSRTKNAINDLKGVSVAYNAYFDRYHQIPGDDGPTKQVLQARGGAWTNISSAGNMNGVLDISAAQTFTGAGENDAFWQHVRAAGFISGDVTLTLDAALPRNAFSGLTGVTGTAVTGMPANGKYVCMGSVPGKAARAIDVALDDGVPNTGSMMATQGVTNTAPGTAATTYSEAQTYTICSSL